MTLLIEVVVLFTVLLGCAGVSRTWPQHRTSAWLVARASHLALPGVLALGLVGGWPAIVCVPLTSLITAVLAPTVSGAEDVRGNLLDIGWWAAVGGLTGLAVLGTEALGGGPAVLAVVVVLLVGLGLLGEVLAGRAASGRTGLPALGATEFFAIISISTTAAALVAALPSVGWWFVPVALMPLVNIAGALAGRRRAMAVAQETDSAIGRLPDVAGYTPEGHAERVAVRALAIGREMELDDVALDRLRQAALLHDVGLVSLRTRIRNGSTSLLAPLDQQRVAERSAVIAADLPADPAVVETLRFQAHSYIDHVMYRADVPKGSRILKVANALEDYSEGRPGRAESERALSRVRMQQGYEFDPAVVSAARRALMRAHLSA